jgi:hypothetical protein
MMFPLMRKLSPGLSSNARFLAIPAIPLQEVDLITDHYHRIQPSALK